MNVTIWKYKVMPDAFTLNMPRGAQFLGVHEQAGHAQAWFLVDPFAPKVDRMFYTVGTGFEFFLEESDQHLGTFLMMSGHLVFHLFERTKL